MRNTWWITRPKRDLALVPLCLTAIANIAEGTPWRTPGKKTELAVEANLEAEGVKAPGKRRDQGGGGARTYRSWMKGLGLAFMDDDDQFQLTLAGAALVQGAPPLPILKNQVLKLQFPSATAHKGLAGVHDRFQVRPAIFILQLLTDPRLGGTLAERDEVGKIAACYGTSNDQATVDDVVERILAHRKDGDSSLDPDYITKFGVTPRTPNPSMAKVVENLGNIANTLGNWLGYAQLITREAGQWEITAGAEDEVKQIIQDALDTPLIPHPDDEERFQRRYGLTPGKTKDTRRLGQGRTVTSSEVKEREINTAFMRAAGSQIITRIDSTIIDQIATTTGYPATTVEKTLAKTYPDGAVGTFMHSYAQMAFESRDRATDFEKATASVFRDVFGFKAEHIGQRGRVPDVVIASETEHYGALLDSKAYAKGYSIGISQQNRMRDYIADFPNYRLSDAPLAFFAYVVAEYKSTINGQLKEIAETNGVPGSAITARDIIRMVEHHQDTPYTHAQIRELLSVNRAVTYQDLS